MSHSSGICQHLKGEHSDSSFESWRVGTQLGPLGPVARSKQGRATTTGFADRHLEEWLWPSLEKPASLDRYIDIIYSLIYIYILIYSII
jgi:hypothetical protein